MNKISRDFDDCAREVQTILRRQTLHDVCLCRKYGKYIPSRKYCPVCEEVTSHTHVSARKKIHASHVTKIKDTTEWRTTCPENNLPNSCRPASRKILPIVIPAQEFITRYYLPYLLEGEITARDKSKKSRVLIGKCAIDESLSSSLSDMVLGERNYS